MGLTRGFGGAGPVAQWCENTRLPAMLVGFKSRSVDAICGLSLLLVLCFAPRGFSCLPRPHNPTESKFCSNSTSIGYWYFNLRYILRCLLCNANLIAHLLGILYETDKADVKSSLSKRSQLVLLVLLFMKSSLYIIESTSLPLCEMIVNTTMLKNTLK